MEEDPNTRMKKEIYEWATIILLMISILVLLEVPGVIFSFSNLFNLVPFGALSITGGIIGRLLVYLGVHKGIDNRRFSARKRVDELITNEIIDSVSGSIPKLLKASDPEQVAMDVFYDFVNDETATRNLAFTYWGDYYVSLYLILYSFVYLVLSVAMEVTIVILWLTQNIIQLYFVWSTVISILGIILGALFSYVFYSRERVRKEKNLFCLANTQLRKITTQQRTDLEKRIRSRLA